MKLKEYSTQNVPILRMKKPTIRINSITGLIAFSQTACNILDIKMGDKLKFYQDEEESSDWYVSKSADENAFNVRGKSKGSIGIGNVFLARNIMKSVNCKEKTIGFYIAEQPTEEKKNESFPLFAILTHNPFK